MIRENQIQALCDGIAQGASKSALVDSLGRVWTFTEADGFTNLSIDYNGPERREVKR